MKVQKRQKIGIAVVAILLSTIAIVYAASYFAGVSPKYKYNPDLAAGTVEISIDGGTTWTAQDMITEHAPAALFYARWHSTATGHVGSVTVAWQLQSSTDGLAWNNVDPQFDSSASLNGAAGQLINATTLTVWHNFVPSGGFAIDIYYHITVSMS